MRDNSNQRFLDCELSVEMSGGEESMGLYLLFSTLTSNGSLEVPWSPMILNRISDKNFREYNKDQETYRDSKFYEYVKQLKLNSHTLWGSVEADRDFWDSADREDLSFDVVPTLMDPPLSQFFEYKAGVSEQVESVNAWGRKYLGKDLQVLNNIGINNIVFQPGVAGIDDLAPSFHYVITTIQPELNQSVNIGRRRQNNEQVLFSGQR